MWRIGRLLIPGIIVLLNSNVSGKTLITEPYIQPVYIKAGNQLTLRCEQNNNYKIRWSHLPRSRSWGSGSAEYLALSSDAGFNQTMFEQGGHQVNVLIKAEVEVQDSGSYRCDVRSGLDTSYSVDVFVINIQGVDGIMAKVGGEATLQCCISSDEPVTAKFLWFRNNTMLTELPHKYTINSSSGADLTSLLHVSKTAEVDIGEYLCHVTLGNSMNFTHTVHLLSFPHVRPFEKSRTLVEGEDLALECRVWGWPFPTVAWFRNNFSLSTTNGEPRVNFRYASLIANTGLLINNVTYSDRANYTCVATAVVNGTARTGSASIFIRVKGRLAPLYPLLGIIAEMFTLFVIILIYERRRRRQRAKELSESADDLFRPTHVKDAMHNIVAEYLHGKEYKGEECTEWCRDIATLVKNRVKEMGYDRYKFTVQVTIGEQRGEGVKMGCRCFWDSDTDNYAQDIYMNDTLFCVVACFAVFFY